MDSFGAPMMRAVGGPSTGLQSRVDSGPFRSSPHAPDLHLTSHSLPAFLRHGSGAGSDPMDTGFRRRRPRSPSPDRGRGGLQPAGPITANEWTDAVETLQAQIAALNRTVADHATFIGKMRTELDQSTIPQIVQRIGGLEESVTQRFEHGWAAVGRKHDVLTAELRAFAAQLNQPPPEPPEPPPGMTSAPGDTAANFNVSTPPRDGRSDNPFHIGGHMGMYNMAKLHALRLTRWRIIMILVLILCLCLAHMVIINFTHPT